MQATYDQPNEITIPVMATSPDEAMERAMSLIARRRNPEVIYAEEFHQVFPTLAPEPETPVENEEPISNKKRTLN